MEWASYICSTVKVLAIKFTVLEDMRKNSWFYKKWLSLFFFKDTQNMNSSFLNQIMVFKISHQRQQELIYSNYYVYFLSLVPSIIFNNPDPRCFVTANAYPGKVPDVFRTPFVFIDRKEKAVGCSPSSRIPQPGWP